MGLPHTWFDWYHSIPIRLRSVSQVGGSLGSGVEFLVGALRIGFSLEVLLPFMSYHFSVDGGESWGYFELQKVRHS